MLPLEDISTSPPFAPSFYSQSTPGKPVSRWIPLQQKRQSTSKDAKACGEIRIEASFVQPIWKTAKQAEAVPQVATRSLSIPAPAAATPPTVAAAPKESVPAVTPATEPAPASTTIQPKSATPLNPAVLAGGAGALLFLLLALLYMFIL